MHGLFVSARSWTQPVDEWRSSPSPCWAGGSSVSIVCIGSAINVKHSNKLFLGLYSRSNKVCLDSQTSWVCSGASKPRCLSSLWSLYSGEDNGELSTERQTFECCELMRTDHRCTPFTLLLKFGSTSYQSYWSNDFSHLFQLSFHVSSCIAHFIAATNYLCRIYLNIIYNII
jgi:hypothetical protein